MSALARMAGIQEGGIGDKRLIQAISMGKDNMQQLVAIANGAPPQERRGFYVCHHSVKHSWPRT